MSFGRAFDAFVGGLESGLKSGGDMQDKALARRPAKEKADLDKNVRLGDAPVQGLGTLQGRVQTNSEAIPTTPSSPEEEGLGGMYATGGYVDPVEQDNGSYAREEAQRAQQREAVPTAPVNDNVPTPPARPAAPDQDIPTDKGGNIITQTVEAVKAMPGTAAAGAIHDPSQPAQGPVHPIQEMVDLSGKSYPDLTSTIGGIRQVTGAPANRPLTTADHVDFLQRRVEYARAHGYDMNEVLRFNVQYLDNLRFQAGRTFALAGAAWDAGDGAAVQKFVQQGYGFLPDGLSAQTSFKDGALHVQAIDEKTGKPVGSPMSMNKQQFLQKAQSITGDPVSWGAAIENVPYTAGTTSAARGGRGRGRYRTSDAGTGGDPAAAPAKADKPLPTSVFKGRDLGVATTIRDAIADPKAGRDAGHIQGYIQRAKGPPRDGDEGFGIYDKNDKLVVKLDPTKLGVKPANKVQEAATAPVDPAPAAAPAAPKGLGITKTGPAAVAGAAPKPANGSAAASTGTQATAPSKPAPTKPTQAIPTDDYPEDMRSTQTQPEGPGLIEQGRQAARRYIVDKLGGEAPKPSTAPAETSDKSGDTLVRINEMEKKLAAARASGQVPEGSLKIMQTQIDRERAKLK